MPDNILTSSPDFLEINKEAGVATEDAVRLLWNLANQEAIAKQRHRFQWQDAPFASIGFSAIAGTWTVQEADFTGYKFALFGDTLITSVILTSTSTSAGMGSELYVTLPQGMIAVSELYPAMGSVSGNINEAIRIRPLTSDLTKLKINRLDASAFPSSITNDLTFRFTWIGQVKQ